MSINYQKQEIEVNYQVESYLSGNISFFKAWLNTTSRRNIVLVIQALQQYDHDSAIDSVLNLLD